MWAAAVPWDKISDKAKTRMDERVKGQSFNSVPVADSVIFSVMKALAIILIVMLLILLILQFI